MPAEFFRGKFQSGRHQDKTGLPGLSAGPDDISNFRRITDFSGDMFYRYRTAKDVTELAV